MKSTSSRIRFTVAAFGLAAAAIGTISAAAPALAANPGVTFDTGRPALAADVFIAPPSLGKKSDVPSPRSGDKPSTRGGVENSAPRRNP